MSEFIKIKPVGSIVTGSNFRIQSGDISASAIITSINGDSLFTTELKEGDKITFYNKYNSRNFLTKTYTVDSITSATVFVAKEVVILDNDLSKADQDGKVTFRYATKEIDTYYNTYSGKRILKSSIVGYKEDEIMSDLSLLDVDSNLVDIDEYNLISISTPIEYGGASANQKDLKVLGNYTENSSSNYKVEIDGAGTVNVTTVTCVADSAGSLDRTGFYFYTPYKEVIGVIIVVNRADDVPSASPISTYDFKFLIVVKIDEGTSANDVCTAVFDAIDDSGVSEFTVSNKSSATFRINNATIGKCDVAKVLTSMTSTSTGISFSSVDGKSSLTDTNFASDGLTSTTWKEHDKIEIVDSEKNNGFYKVHSRTDGTIIIKGDEFVDEDAGYPVRIKNGAFESSGFTFATTTTGTNCTFKWSDTNGEIWNVETVTILGMHNLNNGVRILFPKINGYTATDYWTFTFPKPNMIKTRNSIKELDNIYKCTEVC